MTYQEKLKDPRWKAKRLEILERDNHICQECDRSWPELHVHHKYYKRNADPWEYDNSALVTMCDNCHRQIHYFLEEHKGYRKEDYERVERLCESFLGRPCVFFKCLQ